MIDPVAFLRAARAQGVTFFAGVPDSLLQDLCACLLDEVGAPEHFIAANEGGAVAAAIGSHLATGRTPLVYMQNSGLPNALNPLLSLADPAVYAIPMLLVIGWRGEPGTTDEPQHVKQGAVTLPLLEACAIRYHLLDSQTSDIAEVLGRAFPRDSGGPSALVVRKGTFRQYGAGRPATSGAFSREEAIATIVDLLPPDALTIATTGMTARELSAHRDGARQPHERDFLVVGGMGHASQIAQTLAAYRPDRLVCCLDGDGALVMHMGALASIGAARPPNLLHVVLNNGVHESVGGQPTVAVGIDMPALGRAVGYASALRVTTLEDLRTAIEQVRHTSGPTLLEVRVSPGHRTDLARPALTPTESKAAFMRALAR